MIYGKKALLSEGDIVYRPFRNEVYKVKIVEVRYYGQCDGHFLYKGDNNESYYDRHIGKLIFYNEQDALKYLDKQNKIKQKRKLLKEYETKLNKELNIENHRYF
jgi:hypothetical protein